MNALLETAIDRAIDNLKSGGRDNAVLSYKDAERLPRYQSGGLPDLPGHVARLRLDAETPDDSDVDVRVLIKTFLKADLNMLLEEGDTGLTADPLLKAFDGIKKRGKQPTDVDLISVNVYAEHKERKATIEYTTFVLLYMEWE